MKKTTLGLAMCGSFCTFSRVLDAFEALDRERFDLVPIMSQVSFETDSRFGPAAQFRERLEAIYDSPDALAQSLAGYDYSEDGTAPYGYSYLADGKVWICMEVPHALGDYIEIELDTQ